MSSLTVKIEHTPLLVGLWAGENITQAAVPYTEPSAVYAVIGPSGSPASISTEIGNQLTVGSDGKLYMGHPSLETAQW
jgi:hypothetical protein